jgi:hypothetical protein
MPCGNRGKSLRSSQLQCVIATTLLEAISRPVRTPFLSKLRTSYTTARNIKIRDGHHQLQAVCGGNTHMCQPDKASTPSFIDVSHRLRNCHPLRGALRVHLSYPCHDYLTYLGTSQQSSTMSVLGIECRRRYRIHKSANVSLCGNLKYGRNGGRAFRERVIS